jgi:radical SAM superfamily enzyme YgiQ (UPF0313 family)
MLPPWEPKRPPLGLAYISEYLRSKGLKPKVIDFNLQLYRKVSADERLFWKISNINSMPPHEIASKMFNSFKDEIDELINQIISCNCDLIGFSVNITSIGLAGKITTLIKKRDKNKKVILGGTGCFWEQDRSLISPEDMRFIDAFIIGEGEETLEKMLDNYKNFKRFEGVKGVICQKEDFLKPAVSTYIPDIDALPFPRFSDFNLNLYTEKQIPMLTSRGCIGRCAYCIDYLMCGTYRYRSPEKILEEIKYHIDTYKISDFAFNDLICNGNLRQLEKLCDLIIQSDFNITWGSYAMLRKDMNLELLKKMKKAGCVLLCYGMESASNRTLKRMNKFYTAEDAERVIRDTYKAGIQTAINIIVGFPGETEDDFKHTLSFIKRNKDYIYEITNISSFVIMPGSRMGRSPQEYGIELPPANKDLNLYEDENRLNFMGRLRRVRETIFVVSNLEIRNVIVNQPGLPSYDNKETIALVFCPPASIDLIPLRLTSLFSSLRKRQFNPYIYDFNINLYREASGELKGLWNFENRHLWSFKQGLLSIFSSLEKELFLCTEQLISLRTNIFCFLITKENFAFSLKISSLLKKFNPNTVIIFAGPILEREGIYELIPQGLIDILVFAQEEVILPKILSTETDYQSLPNISVYKDGEYLRSERRILDADREKEIRDFVDFSEFNLKSYGSSKLPLCLA